MTIATYENILIFSCSTSTLDWLKKVPKSRLCFSKLSKYQKLPTVYLNIYHREISTSLFITPLAGNYNAKTHDVVIILGPYVGHIGIGGFSL